MAAKSSAAVAAPRKTLTLTRVVDAPRSLVFKAWTDEKQLAKWWGPVGFTNPVCKLEARKGSAIRIDMKSPDGTVYPMTGRFTEVAAPDRIAFLATPLDVRGYPMFETLTTVTLTAQSARTKIKVQVKVTMATPEAAPYLAGMEPGWGMTLDRLGAYVSDTKDREIYFERIFDAPRDVVWKAWTDPKQVVQWWGPKGFTNTLKKHEVKPGGVWEHVMHGPDGTNYPNRSVFIEVVKNERLVYSHGGGKGKNDVDVTFFSTITFEAQGKKTKLTMRGVFQTAGEREHAVKTYGAIEGGTQTLDRLGTYVASMATKPFIIEREFDAPRKVVWKAWTDRKQLAEWMGPKGFKMPTAKLDLRPGGMFHYQLKAANGAEMWGKWVFLEIDAPERLVWMHSFSDPQGTTAKHAGHAEWPLEMVSIATFTERKRKTTVRLEWRAVNATPSEQAVFDGAHDGMKMGWTGTFEQLDAYLAGR